MRFVHITDTHVGPTAQYKVMGHRSMPILEALVERVFRSRNTLQRIRCDGAEENPIGLAVAPKRGQRR